MSVPSHAPVPDDQPAVFFVDVRAWNAPTWVGAVFVLEPEGRVLRVEGWHDRSTLRCSEAENAAWLVRHQTLIHCGPRNLY